MSSKPNVMRRMLVDVTVAFKREPRMAETRIEGLELFEWRENQW